MWSATFWRLFLGTKGLGNDLREIDGFRRLSVPQARQNLARRLQQQIRYFGSREDALPEWRAAAKIRDPLDLWREWPYLPVLTREMLQNRFNASEIRRRFGISGVLSATGGSTGEPTAYLHDHAMQRACTVTQLYARQRMGWRPGMPLICVWGSERDIGKSRSLRHRISALCRNEWLVDGYNLDPNTVERVLRLIRKLAPVALYGFSSMLEFVAREILQVHAELPARCVAVAWNGGEMLFPQQRELFRRAFGTAILDFYGGRELSATAHQTEPGGPLWVVRPYVFLEIVDNTGKPSPPGASGRIVLTSTVCRGTPFVRYEIGDLGCYGHCDADDSGIVAIRQLQGRTAGLLELPNGKVINCIYWNHLLKGFSEVHQFQVVLERRRSIELRLCGRGFTAERQHELQRLLGQFLGGIPAKITWVRRIPLTGQGKLVQVIREQ